MGKECEKFTKEDIPKANKHMKIYSTILVIWETNWMDNEVIIHYT